MIAALGKRMSGIAERWMPDPFVFAILLTVVTFVLALLADTWAGAPVGTRLGKLAAGWYGEFFGNAALTKFAMQMVLVLVTGHAIATSHPARRAIEKVTGLAHTPSAAAAVVAFFACAASLVQWGLGAIAGAFLAREMGRAFARRGAPVHYPLLGAAGYAGFLVWHGGLSGSAPLSIAEPGHFLEDRLGVIPVTETIFSPLNLIVTGVLVVTIVAVFYALMPRDPAEMAGFELGDEVGDDAQVSLGADGRHPLVRLLEESRALSLAAAACIATVGAWWFAEKGLAGWNLDSINLLFLAMGLALHRSPAAYMRAVVEGARGAAGIILQFPFYFGILGLLKASGLIVEIANFFVAISSPATFPLFTFLSAGLVNLFVPSGGGQWAVQGPVMVQALDTLAVDPAKVVMALAYGDAWTNMLQPFWALPLLGIMGLRARDIIGYTTFVMLVTGPIILLLLTLL